MSAKPPALDMGAILADTSNRVVVCCGAGGVGKTTTAAAMALRAAEYDRTVVVLTIDPAKRLAQALGIKDLGNTPQRVPLAPEVTGELHAMMLDMRRTFDEMVQAHSTPDRAEKILAASHRRAAQLAQDIREMRALRTRLAETLRSAAETHIALLATLEADVAASGTQNERLQMVVSATGGSAEAAARRGQRVVEWAVAVRMLELHGGELETNEQRPGPVKCVLTLPLAR